MCDSEDLKDSNDTTRYFLKSPSLSSSSSNVTAARGLGLQDSQNSISQHLERQDLVDSDPLLQFDLQESKRLKVVNVSIEKQQQEVKKETERSEDETLDATEDEETVVSIPMPQTENTQEESNNNTDTKAVQGEPNLILDTQLLESFAFKPIDVTDLDDEPMKVRSLEELLKHFKELIAFFKCVEYDPQLRLFSNTLIRFIFKDFYEYFNNKFSGQNNLKPETTMKLSSQSGIYNIDTYLNSKFSGYLAWRFPPGIVNEYKTLRKRLYITCMNRNSSNRRIKKPYVEDDIKRMGEFSFFPGGFKVEVPRIMIKTAFPVQCYLRNPYTVGAPTTNTNNRPPSATPAASPSSTNISQILQTVLSKTFVDFLGKSRIRDDVHFLNAKANNTFVKCSSNNDLLNHINKRMEKIEAENKQIRKHLSDALCLLKKIEEDNRKQLLLNEAKSALEQRERIERAKNRKNQQQSRQVQFTNASHKNMPPPPTQSLYAFAPYYPAQQQYPGYVTSVPHQGFITSQQQQQHQHQQTQYIVSPPPVHHQVQSGTPKK